ncbi:hypothetical protein [Marinibacterium profundimaris]|uniref:Uncharacterized protein n=1 Tax=Marinibacterium profundimaris TaxID=1679460 RepID=A0A225NSR3_9RHOB|nr:hypothetical protein [Marinibacterium profundimaris]OWU77951.1 hypothetical protein ATO3_04785 [Marinibacterium profundimaris]
MPAPFLHRQRGRRPAPLAALLAAWAGLIALWLGLQASPWILAPLALATLPALRDVIADPRATLTLDDTRLHWQSGRREGTLALAKIEQARFHTAWDFSVLVSFRMRDGRNVQLPPDIRPPHRLFEDALATRGVATVRHHFTLRSHRAGRDG